MSDLGFSRGDWIALAVVVVNVLAFTRGLWRDRSSEDTRQDEKIQTLRADFDVHVATNELQFKHISEALDDNKHALDRIDERVTGLNRQMGYLSKTFFGKDHGDG